MRALQRRRTARLLVALVVSAGLALVAWWAGTVALLVTVFVLLVAVTFTLLTLATDVIALWRGHSWRWWGRSSDDDGPFWLGTRIPRRPHPPRMPPRGAAAQSSRR